MNNSSERCKHIASIAALDCSVSMMAAPRIDRDEMRDGIAELISSCDLASLDYSFLTSHNVSYGRLLLALEASFDLRPSCLATWRDPDKRLWSSLVYLLRSSGGDVNSIRERIHLRDPFLDNAIYRGCFDAFDVHDLRGEHENVLPRVDHLVSIENFSIMNEVMSGFLTRCRLPNIVVNKSVNGSLPGCHVHSAVVDSLMAECVDSGFLDFDLKCQDFVLEEGILPDALAVDVSSSSVNLHPWTYLVSASTDDVTGLQNSFVPTAFLASDEGQEFLLKTFAE